MLTKFRTSTKSNSIIVVCTLVLSSSFCPSASAASLNGQVEKHGVQEFNAGASSSSAPLQGGIKDEQTLKPSVKVLPGSARKERFVPGRPRTDSDRYGGVTQYNGSNCFPSGSRSPHFDNPPRIRHSIPPVSTYHHSSSSGVTTYDPEYESLSTYTNHRSSNWFPGSHESRPVSRNGVTSYAPDYDVVSTGGGASSWLHETRTSGFSAGRGITAFASGYGILSSHRGSSSSSTYKGITSWSPGHEIKKNESSGILASNGSGTGMSISRTTRKGVTCWSPGYEVFVSTSGTNQESLHGWWSTGGNSGEPPLIAKGEKDKPEQVSVVPMTDSGPQLQASPGLLPGLRSPDLDPGMTWKDWYNRVASAIYRHWSAVEVGPGIAKVRLTVDRNKQIICQVVDFMPAPYVERNVASETEFKVAALNAVRNVPRYEIPSFPVLSGEDKVTFDVVLKRTVDGDAGIDTGSGPRAPEAPSTVD